MNRQDNWDKHIEKLNKISYALLEKAEQELATNNNGWSVVDNVVKTLDMVRKCIDTVYKLRLAQKDIAIEYDEEETDDGIELEFEPVNGELISETDDATINFDTGDEEE